MRRLPGLVVCSFLPLGLATLLSACGEGTTDPAVTHLQGIEVEVLESVAEELENIPASLSFLVQRNGVLVAEHYFHGFSPDSLYDVRSVTKSVVGMLVGLALEDGFISSLDDPIGDYLASTVDSIRAQVAEIPIRYFLTMSSGLDWHELDGGSSYSQWWESSDMVQHVVDLPMVHAPGAQFIYNTGASHLLSVVLTEATGMPTLDYARQVLFEPMDINGCTWLQENRGYYAGGMGLRITARNMVKLGQMFLDGGQYQGTRILSAEWVSASVTPHLSTGNVNPYGPSYGYLWWIGSGAGRDFFFANGYGGQFILVDPDHELVVVTQNRWRGTTWDEAGAQWYQVIQLLVENLLPAVE